MWLAVINGIMALILWVGPATEPELQVSLRLCSRQACRSSSCAAQATAIGVAVLGQGAIIGEKQSGTAAWVLSKPLSRSAFITAKLIALSLGVVTTAIALLQGAVACSQTAAAAHLFPALLPFIAGLGVVALHTFFYLALTVMIGGFVSSRGAAIGIRWRSCSASSCLAGSSRRRLPSTCHTP